MFQVSCAWTLDHFFTFRVPWPIFCVSTDFVLSPVATSPDLSCCAMLYHESRDGADSLCWKSEHGTMGTFTPKTHRKTTVEPNLGDFQVPAVGVQWLDTERGLYKGVFLWCALMVCSVKHLNSESLQACNCDVEESTWVSLSQIHYLYNSFWSLQVNHYLLDCHNLNLVGVTVLTIANLVLARCANVITS